MRLHHNALNSGELSSKNLSHENRIKLNFVSRAGPNQQIGSSVSRKLQLQMNRDMQMSSCWFQKQAISGAMR